MTFLFYLSLSTRCKAGDSGLTSLSEALKVNSSLTQLDLGMKSVLLSCFYCLSLSNGNKIGHSGLSSLSDALTVNSSLTQLNLRLDIVLFSVEC